MLFVHVCLFLQHEVALLEEEKLLLEERVKELTVSLEKALEQERVTIMIVCVCVCARM